MALFLCVHYLFSFFIPRSFSFLSLLYLSSSFQACLSFSFFLIAFIFFVYLFSLFFIFRSFSFLYVNSSLSSSSYQSIYLPLILTSPSSLFSLSPLCAHYQFPLHLQVIVFCERDSCLVRLATDPFIFLILASPLYLPYLRVYQIFRSSPSSCSCKSRIFFLIFTLPIVFQF